MPRDKREIKVKSCCYLGGDNKKRNKQYIQLYIKKTYIVCIPTKIRQVYASLKKYTLTRTFTFGCSRAV